MKSRFIDFDVQLFLSKAQSLCRSFTRIETVSVCPTGTGQMSSGRHTATEGALVAAVMSSLRSMGLDGTADDILIRKSQYGLPIIKLSASLSEKAMEKNIKHIFASATNDRDVTLGMTVILFSGQKLDVMPAGIGIDLMFLSTAQEMILDSNILELEQMYKSSELEEALRQNDKYSATNLLVKAICSKEAAFKAVSEAYHNSGIKDIDKGVLDNASFCDIKISGLNSQYPLIITSGSTKTIADKVSICNIPTTTIDGGEYVGAIAIALTPIEKSVFSEEELT